MRRPVLPVLLVALTLGAGSGMACSADEPAGSPAEGAGSGPRADTDNPTVRPHLAGSADTVLVIGDSLVNGARLFGDLGDRLDAAGFEGLEIVAEDGRDPAWGVEQVEDMDEVPEVVVIELGTNPDADPDGFAETATTLVAALRARGAERIAWLTPVHARDGRYDEKVAILAAVPGLDEIADWASVVRDDPRRLAADGLHPTRDGYSDLAEFVVDVAASLAR
jgi:lysophospholipase L1-like esterase